MLFFQPDTVWYHCLLNNLLKKETFNSEFEKAFDLGLIQLEDGVTKITVTDSSLTGNEIYFVGQHFFTLIP